jgi:hypothetical protein
MEEHIFGPENNNEYREEKEDDIVLTEHGHKKLQEELDNLQNVKRNRSRLSCRVVSSR